MYNIVILEKYNYESEDFLCRDPEEDQEAAVEAVDLVAAEALAAEDVALAEAVEDLAEALEARTITVGTLAHVIGITAEAVALAV